MFGFWAKKRGAQVQPYRPVVENLEGRSLMSAAPADANWVGDLALSYTAGAGAGKVSMQDFHFVMRSAVTHGATTDDAAAAATSSHGTGAGAGKVSMQDFHFVMKNNSSSPKL